MSVSESLARLRESDAVNQTRPRSILHSSVESSKIPLSEQAAVALNSLRALSQTNGKLLNLASDLLLLSPVVRETLDSEAETTLSTACVLTSAYLSPIFPLRHAQRVYEWLVNGMQGGRLGSNAEVEALLFSALPFHATTHFPRFVAALDYPNLHKRWHWLLPISRQEKPASLSYVVINCPASIHRRAIDWTSFLTKKGIPTLYSSSILINITARWAVSTSQSSRRTVALRSLDALNVNLTGTKVDAQVVCAHLILLSICTFQGLSDEVVRVFAGTIVKGFNVLLKSNSESLLQISLRALDLIFSRYNPSILSLEGTFRVLQLPLPVVIGGLSGNAPKFYSSLIHRLLDNSLPVEISLESASSELDGEKSPVPRDGCVASAVEKLLELSSEVIDSGSLHPHSSTQTLHSLLKSTISVVAQSKFADAMQLGIKRYFSGCDFAMQRTKGSLFVEELITLTQSNVVTELSPAQSEYLPQEDFAQLVLLESPSRSVRLQGLAYFLEQHKKCRDGRSSLKLWAKLMSLIGTEPDIEVLSSGGALALQYIAVYDCDELFRVFGSRLAALSEIDLQETDGRFWSATLDTFVILCENLARNNAIGVSSFLTGGLFGGMFSSQPKSIQSRVQALLESCFKLISGSEFVSTNNEKSGDIIATTSTHVSFSLDRMSYSDVFRFMSAVSGWSVLWLFRLASSWTSQFAIPCSEAQIMLRVRASLNCLQSFVALLTETQLEIVLSSCLKASSRPSVSIESKLTCSSLMLRFALSSYRDSVSAQFLTSVSGIEGLDHVLRVLKNCSQTDDDELIRRRSLSWYLSLALTENSEHRAQEVFDHILAIYYGNDNFLRSEVTRFCQNAIRGKIGKKLIPLTKQLLLLLPPLSDSLSITSFELDSPGGTSPGNVVLSYLRQYVIYPCSQSHDLPRPLLAVSPSSVFVQNVELSLSSTLESAVMSPNLLPFLRAFDGYTLTTKETVLNMFCALKSLFDHMPHTGSSSTIQFYTEAIARCVSFLIVIPSTLCPKDTVSNTLLAVLSAFNDGRSSDAIEIGQTVPIRLAKLVTLAALVLVHSPDGNPDTPDELTRAVIRCLCCESMGASLCGEFANNFLDVTFGSLVPVPELLNHISNLQDYFVQICSKKTLDNGIEPLGRTNNLIKIGLGALGAIQRCLRRSDKLQVHKFSMELKSLTWQLLKVFCTDLSYFEKLLGEHHYRTILSMLDILRDLCLSDDGCVQYGEESSLSLLFHLLRNFRSATPDTETSIKASSLRSAVFNLVDVLKAARVAPYAISEIFQGLFSEDTHESRVCLQKLIMFLDRSGGDTDYLSKLLLDSLYQESKVICKSNMKSAIASCFRKTTDPKRALETFLNGMVSKLTGELASAIIGSEYALWLVNSKLSVTTCIRIISQTKDPVQCHIVSSYFLQPSVIAEVSAILHEGETIEDDIKFGLEKQLRCLLLSVLSSEEHLAWEDATKIVLAIFPTSILRSVLEEILKCPVYETRLRGLVSFTERFAEIRFSFLNDQSAINENSVEDGSSRESERVVHNILVTLSQRLDLLCSDPNSSELSELGELARAIEVAMKNDGRCDCDLVFGSILKAAAFLKACNEKMKERDSEGSGFAAMTRSCFSLFSSAISKYKERAISIIPICLDISVSHIDTAFGNENRLKHSISDAWMASVVSVVEGAIQVCVSVIDSAPLFFGENILERLFAQVLLRDIRSIRDVVNIALEEMPLTTSLNALYRASGNTRVPCFNGLESILHSLKHCIEVRSKGEVKTERTRLLEYGLTSVEKVCGCKLQTRIHFNKHTLAETFGDFLVALALRLPEPEFEKTFESMLQWSGANKPQETGSITSFVMGVPKEASVHKLIPFFCATDKLLHRLGSAMVPFCLRILGKIISIISDTFGANNSTESQGHFGDQSQVPLLGKKRKEMSNLDDAAELLEAHHELQNLCLKILTSFLGLSAAGKLEESLVVSLINAMLVCFDTNQGMSNGIVPALSALGVHISTMCSLPGSNERSRQLLLILSRELLSRTKSPQTNLRHDSLVAAKAIAVAVGVEYIVTIPESLPILAEVIDDESVLVRKAANDYVATLEDISGEQLLNQIS